MSPPPVRVALVGAGSMARAHALAFTDLPGAALVGVCSRTRARADALAADLGIEHVCDGLDELAARARPDLLVVTVSVQAIHDVAQAALALDHPWALLLEKPPGLTPAETQTLADNARAQGRHALVGLNRQWLSSTQAVLDELTAADGRRLIVVEDAQSIRAARAAGHPPSVVDGWMYANSIHLVDYFRYLARGAATAVTPVIAWDADDPRQVVTRIDFDSGDVGLYQAIWDAPGPWAVTAFVPGHRWELRPLERGLSQREGQRPGRVLSVDARDERWKPGLRLQAERAIAAVRGEDTGLPTVEDALTTMRLIERIYT